MWFKYDVEVLPKDACETQRIETRRCFYAAVHRFLQIMKGPMSDLSDDAGVAYLESIEAEITDFVKRVDGGKA
jgi:hypothetical protein